MKGTHLQWMVEAASKTQRLKGAWENDLVAVKGVCRWLLHWCRYTQNISIVCICTCFEGSFLLWLIFSNFLFRNHCVQMTVKISWDKRIQLRSKRHPPSFGWSLRPASRFVGLMATGIHWGSSWSDCPTWVRSSNIFDGKMVTCCFFFDIYQTIEHFHSFPDYSI